MLRLSFSSLPSTIFVVLFSWYFLFLWNTQLVAAFFPAQSSLSESKETRSKVSSCCAYFNALRGLALAMMGHEICTWVDSLVTAFSKGSRWEIWDVRNTTEESCEIFEGSISPQKYVC